MRLHAPSAILLTILILAPVAAVSPGYEDVAARLADVAGVDVAEPAPRTQDLLTLVAEADAHFGIVRAPGAYDALATLDPRLADVTADLLDALLVAAAERDAAFAGVTDAELAALGDTEASPEALALLARVDADRVRAAAVRLARAVEIARPTLTAIAAELPPAPALAPAPAPAVDIFPVLGIDPIGVANAFPHDYFLSLDLGGNDVYDNNAGGSIITNGFKWGDPSTFGPSVSSFTIGGEFEDAGESYTATLAIDVAGDDTYGVYKTPSLVGGSRDKQCTQGPLVRRIVVQGSGSGGIGELYDWQGNDLYRGKTLAQGNGHVKGVGVLVDAAGNDRYTAVRSMQGSSVLDGLGFLLDAEGDDVFESVSPPGGIFNVDRGRCDASLRLSLGTAVIEGAALFLDAKGDDDYRVSSQGLGHNEALGVGIFLDLAGQDAYNGYPGRGNGVQLVTPGGAAGAGVFKDAE